MEHPFLFFTWLVEKIGFAHFAHTYTHVIYSWVVMLLLLIAGKMCIRDMNVVPGNAQNVAEVIVGGIENFQLSVMGEKGRPFFPLIATLFLYILAMNWLGQVPGFIAPTANLNTTVPMAIIVFVLTHIIGIKIHGFSYVKQFLGPVWWLAPLMLPIELVSHFARIISLSFRLFGNILGEELVVSVLIMLAGMFLAPLPMQVLGFFTAFLQAFIFALLAMIYISGAMEDAH